MTSIQNRRARIPHFVLRSLAGVAAQNATEHTGVNTSLTVMCGKVTVGASGFAQIYDKVRAVRGANRKRRRQIQAAMRELGDSVARWALVIGQLQEDVDLTVWQPTRETVGEVVRVTIALRDYIAEQPELLPAEIGQAAVKELTEAIAAISELEEAQNRGEHSEQLLRSELREAGRDFLRSLSGYRRVLRSVYGNQYSASRDLDPTRYKRPTTDDDVANDGPLATEQDDAISPVDAVPAPTGANLGESAAPNGPNVSSGNGSAPRTPTILNAITGVSQQPMLAQGAE